MKKIATLLAAAALASLIAAGTAMADGQEEPAATPNSATVSPSPSSTLALNGDTHWGG